MGTRLAGLLAGALLFSLASYAWTGVFWLSRLGPFAETVWIVLLVLAAGFWLGALWTATQLLARR